MFKASGACSAHAHHYALSVQVADTVCARTKLMRWLLSRVKQREFDSVKQYASEVLAILVQNTPANRRRLVQANGIDILLQVGCEHELVPLDKGSLLSPTAQSSAGAVCTLLHFSAEHMPTVCCSRLTPHKVVPPWQTRWSTWAT